MINEMTIRKATIDDLQQITKILNQAIRWGKATAITEEYKVTDREDWFRETNTGKYCIYVAEDEHQITGYLTLTPYRKGRQAFIYTAEVSYFVDFDFHGKRIASKLMNRALDHCKVYKIKTLVAFLMAHNEASVKFMKKYGFELWGLFPQSITINDKEFDHAIYGKRLT